MNQIKIKWKVQDSSLILKRIVKYNSIHTGIIFLISALLVTGCASSGLYGGGYQPQPIPTTNTTEDGVIIAVTPFYWPWTPKNLENYVTPYYVKIVNNSGRTIIVDYEDIVLFDQFKTQYTPLSPDTVASIFNNSSGVTNQGGYSYPQVSVGVGFGFGGGYYGRRGYGRRGYGRGYRSLGIYGYSPVYYYPPPPAYYSKPVNTSDILTQALSLGPVYPGATVTGYLYFRHTISEANHVTLDIGYSVEGTTKHNVVSFPFSVGIQDY